MATNVDLVSTQASRFSVIQPDQLGTMLVLEDLDSETIIADRMTKFVEYWTANDPPAALAYDVAGLEFDPIKILQECAAYFELMLRDRVNQAARAVTLAFAVGTDLDAIATRYPGGVPRLDGETDARYRRRIWLSPNLLSPHGTWEAYVFWALTADATLRDASAMTTPGTGVIYLYIINDGDDPRPSQEQITNVYIYLHERSRKGLTDVIRVVQPKIVYSKYRVRVWLFPGYDEDTAIGLVEDALNALIERRRWIGADHTLMDINAALAQAGVYNVIIDEPSANLVVGQDGFVKITAVEVSYQGTGE